MSGEASRRGAWLAWVVQALLVLAVVAGAFWVVHHALEVLRARGVRSGFDFLTEPAGFSISEGWLDFDASQPFWRALGSVIFEAIPLRSPVTEWQEPHIFANVCSPAFASPTRMLGGVMREMSYPPTLKLWM